MTNDGEDTRSRGFGVLLRNYRTQARITQQGLAEALDVDPTTISRWENGRRNPPQREDIETLSEILGVSEWQRDRLLEAAGNPLPLSQKVDRIYGLLSSSTQQGSVIEKPLEDPPDFDVDANACIPPCPYRGLFTFREEDADQFFGREVYTQKLLETVHRASMVAVVGPSGSGKSSVVFAGLLPRLRQPATWEIAGCRPGSQPFRALAAALVPMLEPEMNEIDRMVETRKLMNALSTGELRLYEIVERVLQKNPEAKRLLLIVDQFEELYTLCREPEERELFLDVLLEAIDSLSQYHASRFTMVFTLRADFFGHASSYRPLSDALQDSVLILGPMTRRELQDTIEQPAQKLGVRIEEGLTERILDSVGEGAGNLPLVEFTLTLLWESQRKRVLTHSAYDQMGGVTGAITGYAEDKYRQLDEGDRKLARKVFSQLVQPGEVTEDTRRLAVRPELGEENWSLVTRLADVRLVISGRDEHTGEETVEIVHEALIREWETLRQWVEIDRGFRSWQERLRAAIHQWESSGKDKGAILRGVPLAEAEGWLAERGDDLSTLEREYIQAGRERHTQIQAAKERQRWRVTLGLATGLLIAVGLALLAGIQWFRAEEQRQVAFSRQLATQALSHMDTQFDLALLLGAEAYRAKDSLETTNVLIAGLDSKPSIATFLHGHTSKVSKVTFSPDGKTLASGNREGAIVLWDVETRQQLGPPLKGHASQVSTLAFSSDGKALTSGSSEGNIILWDVETRQQLGEFFMGHDSAFFSLAFNPDSKMLASNSLDTTVLLWDVETRQQLGEPLRGHTSRVLDLAFSPDGTMLASAGQDSNIILWNVAAHQQLGAPLERHASPASRVTFSPDSTILASGSLDNTVILWDTATQQQIGEPLRGHSSAIASLAFSPDGTVLASGSQDNTIILWDVETRQQLGPSLQGHASTVHGLAFSPDGTVLASSSLDSTVILWNVGTRQQLGIHLRGHIGMVRGLAFNPDGTMLASGSLDSTIILWDTATRRQIGEPLKGHTGTVNAVAFNPDGTMLASGSLDSTIILWDTTARQQIGDSLQGHTSPLYRVAFSPDGGTLVSGSDDNTIILWNIETRQQLGAPLRSNASLGRNLAFSPDGTMLALGSGANTIVLRDVEDRHWFDGSLRDPANSASLQVRACRIANRNLNRSEWELYLGDGPYRKTCPNLS